MRLLVRKVVIIVSALAVIVSAQVGGSATVATDSVDLFALQPRDSVRSAGLAMMGSLLVPGLGHQYLRKPGRALTYYTSELVLIFGAILCESHSRRLFEDSRTIAWTYAGAGGGPGADDKYWQTVGNYLDVDGYNHVQELNRTPESKYVEPDLRWVWADTSYQGDYVRTRDDATSYHVASSFFIGAMVLNRVIAFIDTRITTLRRSSRGISSLRVEPGFSADLSRAEVRFSASY